MSYKESISLFRLLLRSRSVIADTKVPVLDDKEIMLLMSAAQSEIQNRWKPAIMSKQVGYISELSIYNLSENIEAVIPAPEDGGYGTEYGTDYGNT